MKRIIFLDIDGVLNSHQWWDKYNSQNLDDEEGYDFDLDPNAIMTLNKILLKVPDAQIVITSTWRYDYKDTVERLQAQGLIVPILDRTSVAPLFCEGVDMPRGVLVKKWLREHIKEGTCNYVIFDDDQDFLLEQRYNFIHVDTESGLNEEHIHKAINILGTGDHKVSKAVKPTEEDKLSD